MKRKEAVVFLFALLSLASSALAQTPNPPATNDDAKVDVAKSDLPQQVAVARCAYTQTDKACASGANGPKASDPASTTTLAQMPRRYPGPAAGPPMGGPVYSGMWMSQPSPAHILIGGGIGFAIGVALGARGNAGVGGSLGIGTLFGLIGAGMGAMTPSFPSRHYYRRRWPNYDPNYDSDYDEDASRSKPAPRKREAVSRPSAPPAPARSTSTATARSEDPVPTDTRTP
jgi:hypothetical protein